MTNNYIKHKNPALYHYHFVGRGISFKIFPNLGGSIQEIKFGKDDLLKGIPISEEGIGKYQTWFTNAVLFPFPNRLENGTFNHKGRTFQLPINEVSKNNSIHGFLFNCSFEVSKVTASSLLLKYMHPRDENFPFLFKFEITYEFSELGVTINYSVDNQDSNSFPFGIGWHPYFNLEHKKDSSIEFEADVKYIVNDNMIPVGEDTYSEKKISLSKASLDTAFRLVDNKIKLETPSWNLQIKTPKNNYLQLFTPKDETTIAIEPMTCVANAFNNNIGLQILEPNASFDWKIELSFT